MSFKTIKVNPIFLSADSSGFTAKNKTRKEKPAGISLGQSNNIKKKLIARIKNFQQNSKTAPLANTAANTAVNMDVFSDSVQFLDDLARDKEEQKREKKNTTLKKKQPANAYMNIATELPPELNWDTIAPAPKAAAQTAAQTAPGPSPYVVAQTAPQVPSAQWKAQPQPSYSNLKSGTRPTYRTWLRTTQKQKAVRPATEETSLLAPTSSAPTSFAPTSFAPTSSAPTSSAPTSFAVSTEPLATTSLATTSFVPNGTTSLVPNGTTSLVPNGTTSLVPTSLVPPEAAATTSFSAPADTAPASVPNGTTSFAAPAFAYTPSLKPRRKRITRTLKYKLGKHANGKVSVLIKNSQTRRKVQTEQALLKQKSILDIKNHLRSNNLLKVGSNAPNDVLRHLYEQSILAGQVENKAKETLLHNYFNEEKK